MRNNKHRKNKKNPTIDTKTPVYKPMGVYSSIPILNEAVLRTKKLTNELAAFYIIRTYISDYRSSHVFSQKQFLNIVSNYLGCSPQQVYSILKNGNAIFWNMVLGKNGDKQVHIIGAKATLSHFSILPEPEFVKRIEMRSYPISSLKGKVTQRRAHFYKTTICNNNATPQLEPLTDDPRINKIKYIQHSNEKKFNRSSSKPISRETITKRTNVSKQTQLKYEEVCKKDKNNRLWKQFNISILMELTNDQYDELKKGKSNLSREEKNALYKKVYSLTHGEALGKAFRVKVIDRKLYLIRQLSNSYADDSLPAKNVLIPKYFGHSSSTKKKTLARELAEVISNPESNLGQSKFSVNDILFAEEAVHEYIHTIPSSYDERKKKKELVESMSFRTSEYHEIDSLQKSNKHFQRTAVWKRQGKDM